MVAEKNTFSSNAWHILLRVKWSLNVKMINLEKIK